MKPIELTASTTTDGRRREYHLSIDEKAFEMAEFSKSDLGLFRECENSSLISDKMLALQVMVRVIEMAGKT